GTPFGRPRESTAVSARRAPRAAPREEIPSRATRSSPGGPGRRTPPPRQAARGPRPARSATRAGDGRVDRQLDAGDTAADAAATDETIEELELGLRRESRPLQQPRYRRRVPTPRSSARR